MKFDFIPDSVSHFDNAYDVLKERGFIEQSTNEDEIRKLLQNEKVKFYIGFDPTADCLHVGHFMQVIIMMYMQKYGHTPVVLIGGGTGMVGDPSGRTDMRKVMTIETIENNCNQFKKLFDRFYRAAHSRNAATGGFGIGLSIARSIAEAHRGSICARMVGEEVEFVAELR